MSTAGADVRRSLPDAAATDVLGRELAAAAGEGLVIYLHGELGAGKTHLARALLQALGAGARIKSPTYSLVERYDLAGDRSGWHLDLYRIADPGELEWLGLDALGEPRAVVLVEWAARGAGSLPPADLTVSLDYAGDGRTATLHAHSARGQRALDALMA